MRPRLLASLIVIVVALLAASCGRRAAIDTKAPIILISIDTLRSDHLPAYGYTKVETPALDAFRKDAILYERAYSEAPLTLVSHASVFTGELPADHGIRDNLGYDLNPKSKTIAEILKSKGYATGGAVSAVVLRGETGIKRGFDFWNDDIDMDLSSLSISRSQRSGDDTRAIAEKWIGEHKEKPFFFFFHIYEPHSPYEPVEPFLSRYGKTYDGEVATADSIIGKFFDYLKDQGIYDRATIILMSDHGEGLHDHGEDEHGILLYREDIQVPLMLKLPHEAKHGATVKTPVELVDIFPTIAGAFGVQGKTEGRSLLDALNGKVPDDRPLYSETYYPRLHFGWNDLHSIVSGANHYIHGPKPELYDLASDPAERQNVLMDRRRVYVALREKIQPYIHAAAAPSAVDDEQKQQLIALGYVGSTVTTNPNDVLPDPKENILKANDIGAAFRAYANGKYEDADRITATLVRDNPNMLDMLSLRASVLEKLNRTAEAIDTAKQALRLSPSSSNLAMMVARLSLDAGRLDDAEQHARLILKDLPTEGHHLLAEVALARKDYPKARAEAKLALGEKRNRPASILLLGRIEQTAGNLDEAVKDFKEAAALVESRHAHPLPRLNYMLGDTLARLGRTDEAESAFETEIKLFPTDPSAYRNLILLYAAEGKNQQATNLIFSLEKASPTPPSYIAIAETLKIIGDHNGCRFWATRGLQHFPSDQQLQTLARS